MVIDINKYRKPRRPTTYRAAAEQLYIENNNLTVLLFNIKRRIDQGATTEEIDKLICENFSSD